MVCIRKDIFSYQVCDGTDQNGEINGYMYHS